MNREDLREGKQHLFDDKMVYAETVQELRDYAKRLEDEVLATTEEKLTISASYQDALLLRDDRIKKLEKDNGILKKIIECLEEENLGFQELLIWLNENYPEIIKEFGD